MTRLLSLSLALILLLGVSAAGASAAPGFDSYCNRYTAGASGLPNRTTSATFFFYRSNGGTIGSWTLSPFKGVFGISVEVNTPGGAVSYRVELNSSKENAFASALGNC